MNKTKDKLPKVGDCIAYIESCGWKLTAKYHTLQTLYYFVNPKAASYHQTIVFTLTELRHARKYGW